MALIYQITRHPPLPGQHSLGDVLLTFDAHGSVVTDNVEVVQQAKLFPDTFTVQELDAKGQPIGEPANAPPVPDDRPHRDTATGSIGPRPPRAETSHGTPSVIQGEHVPGSPTATKPTTQDPGEGAGQDVITKKSDDRDAPSAEVGTPGGPGGQSHTGPHSEAQAQDVKGADPSLIPPSPPEETPQEQGPPGGRRRR